MLKPRISCRKKIHYARLERGRCFLIVRQRTKISGKFRSWPQLYILIPNGSADFTLQRDEQVQEFFTDHDAKSYQWMLDVARGLGLLVDHSMATLIADPAELGQPQLERRLLRAFAIALRDGTISPSGGKDEKNLYWSPRGSDRANTYLKHLTYYFDWLGKTGFPSKWDTASSIKDWSPDPITAYRLAASLIIRKSNSLLGHLDGRVPVAPHRFSGNVEPRSPSMASVSSFPAQYYSALLHQGFRRRGEAYDETAELLVHILALYGVRQSEGFHLYTSDVQFLNGRAHVHFFDPEVSKVMNRDGHLVSRREYLADFGLEPRNSEKGRFHAGWKGMADCVTGVPGFHLPIEFLTDRTTKLLQRYLLITRPAIMSRRPRGASDHPFLLVSSRTAGSGGEVGDPYTMTAFKRAWAGAIRRVSELNDDSSLTVNKKAGTSPHGLRHFYGRFLWTAGVDGVVIQRCMHHKSYESHKVYTRLSASEIDELLGRYAEGEGRTKSFAAIHDMVANITDTSPANMKEHENA